MEFGGSGGSSRDASDSVPKQIKRKMKTPSQIEMLEQAYAVSSTLSEQMRQELAQKSELSSREISMWFANKRFQGKQGDLPRKFNSSGSETGFVLEACHFMDSAMNETPMPKVPRPKMKVAQKVGQSHHELDPLVLDFMERKLGGRLREDGPLVGMNFDPPPPGAFGSSLCRANEMMNNLKWTARVPKSNSILKEKAGSTKVCDVYHRLESSCQKNSLWSAPIDEIGSSVNPDLVHNLSSKLPRFPSGKQHAQRKEMHPDCALQDAQSTVDPANDIVDKFVLTDTLANDAASQVERLYKSDKAQLTEKVGVLGGLVGCEKQFVKRKREMEAHTDQEICDEERRNGEAVIHEKEFEEGKLKYVDRLDCCQKPPNKGNMEEEKVSQPVELQLEAAAMEEVVSKSFIALENILGNLKLIEDEQLELMKLAASKKGLPSIHFLDMDTLDKLHTFQDILGKFPPQSVLMKRPFPILPWTESEENVGNLLMVWKFLITFAGEFGLWPFTLDEFVQAFHDQDSRLMGEIHVAVLKYIIRDLEDVKNKHTRTPCFSEGNADNSGIISMNIVDKANEWGFDIHFWKSKLNFLTWPEILRQFALSVGFGTKLTKAGYANFLGDKGVKAGYQAAGLDKNIVGSNSVIVQDKKKSSSYDICHQLAPGTMEFAVFHSLFLWEGEGLSPAEVSDHIQEHRLCDLSMMEPTLESISNVLTKNAELFEKVGLVYRVKPCLLSDPSIVEKMRTAPTKSIRLCSTDRDEAIGDSFDEDPLGGEFTGENLCSLNITNILTRTSKSNQNLYTDESGLIYESGFENVDRFSILSLESTEDAFASSGPIESLHDVSGATKDVNGDEQFLESWIVELTEGEYSSLSIVGRLKALVALVGVIVEGNSFHDFVEERLKEAQASKKMMSAKMRLIRRQQEERRWLMEDTNYINADPISCSKQAPDLLCSYDTLNNVSSQKKNLGQEFSSSSSYIQLEQAECTTELCLSQLELCIEQKAEMLHSYRFLPLGLDRRYNRYWQFSTSSSRNDLGSGRIFFESRDGFWRIIDSAEAFDALLAVLDTGGIRESNLYFMLKQVEMTFKDTIKRHERREFHAESTTDTLQMTTTDFSSQQTSALLKIGLFEEDRLSASKKHLNFMKWMWMECLNPHILCAIKYGTRRCQKLLETCHICYQPFLAAERHCSSCHLTFDICDASFEHFSEHLTQCKADFKAQISIPFFPINIQLLKAQLAIIEASIPMESLHPFWDDAYRKSWGMKLKVSSSARELFQSLTVLENAIKPDYLCSDFVTTNELLSSEMDLTVSMSTVSETVPVMPWIPETTAAVALRLLDLDCSIPYMLQNGCEPLEGVDAEEFFVLPRPTATELTHHVESAAFSNDADYRQRGHGLHTEANCLHQEEHVKGRENQSCTDSQTRIHVKDNSDSDDFSSSGNSDDADEASCDLSDSPRGVKTLPCLSYKAGLMDEEDESELGGEFGGGEAVESSEYDHCQGTQDFYLDMEDCLDEHSNIVLNNLDLKSSRWKVAVTTRSADGEENSSSVNTK